MTDVNRLNCGNNSVVYLLHYDHASLHQCCSNRDNKSVLAPSLSTVSSSSFSFSHLSTNLEHYPLLVSACKLFKFVSLAVLNKNRRKFSPISPVVSSKNESELSPTLAKNSRRDVCIDSIIIFQSTNAFKISCIFACKSVLIFAVIWYRYPWLGRV